MNWKLPAAVLSVILAVALIIPAVQSVLPGLGGLTEDLRTGNVSFFNPPKDLTLPPDVDPGLYEDLVGGLDRQFGGLTGESDGGFLPTPGSLPDTWNMDRDGGGGNVTIDYVCDPELGSMKRLKAYDAIGSDYQIKVADTTFYPVSPVTTPPSTHTERFRCRFPVLLDPDNPTPVYSMAPDAVITESRTSPDAGALSIFRDGADTLYVKPNGGFRGVTNLTITFFAPKSYYTLNVPATLTLDAYQRSLNEAKPVFPPERVDAPPIVLEEMGLKGERNVKRILETMGAYFNAFGEGEIPGEQEQRDPYLAIALGKNGCCRHRAFAFLVTAHYLGIPTRLVANEAHAFVEVYIPSATGTGGTWQQLNLGGCGNYSVNNRNGITREYDRDASNPKIDQRPPPPPPA
ncbi:MAG TPA: hypothetical protein VNZ52_02725, partial [Candidatus Thermoplasmatota archaeon]|nr:hypothetical protein [Candidatus Thermoplasmatota archaeon]